MTDLHVRVPESLVADVEALSEGQKAEFVRQALREAVDRRREIGALEDHERRIKALEERIARLEEGKGE